MTRRISGEKVARRGPENAAPRRRRQEKRVHIQSANTTIYRTRAAPRCRLVRARHPSALVAGNQAMNVIIRNLNFEDAAECFPSGARRRRHGNWNSQYDAISVRNATHVWIDQTASPDVRTSEKHSPSFSATSCRYTMARRHRHESDSSRCRGTSSPRTTRPCLIGNSDGALADAGKLHVTLHHNFFDGVGQRTPRVRSARRRCRTHAPAETHARRALADTVEEVVVQRHM